MSKLYNLTKKGQEGIAINKHSEKKTVYTISEINFAVVRVLEGKFWDIWIEGEVTNYKGPSASGHCYFGVKDAQSQISVVAFRSVMSKVDFLKDGIKVHLFGKLSLYQPRGVYQFIVAQIKPIGQGDLQILFENLKATLSKEGLFEQQHKKSIPQFIQKVGIITSSNGAALKDILSVFEKNFFPLEVKIYPVRVQGESAKYDISQAITNMNLYFSDLDVLLVGRGGGSIEDLWSFNEEIVARAIFHSQIPVISCVGHEIDFTIADFVSDYRSQTPSTAAEYIVEKRRNINFQISQCIKRLHQALFNHYRVFELRLLSFQRSRFFLNPESFFEKKLQQIDESHQLLCAGVQNYIEKYGRRLDILKIKLDTLHQKYLSMYEVYTSPGHKVKSVSDIGIGDKFFVQMEDGRIDAVVIDLKKKVRK